MFVEYDTPQQHEQFLKEKKKKKGHKMAGTTSI